MATVRGQGNEGTELALLRFFRCHGFAGWRRDSPVFGKPDFVFPKLKLAAFVDGCFWHSCPRHSIVPVNNGEFWKRKLEGNKRRDWLVNRTLRSRGWRVLRVWEHELLRKGEAKLLRRVQRAMERH